MQQNIKIAIIKIFFTVAVFSSIIFTPDPLLFFSKLFPLFVTVIIVWYNVDHWFLKIIVNEVVKEKVKITHGYARSCFRADTQELCIDNMAETSEMFHTSIGFFYTFFTAGFYIDDIKIQILFIVLSFLSLILFGAYLQKPLKYKALIESVSPRLSNNFPDLLALIYIVFGILLTNVVLFPHSQGI